MGYCIEKHAITCFLYGEKVRKGEKRCIKAVFKYVIIKPSELQVQNREREQAYGAYI